MHKSAVFCGAAALLFSSIALAETVSFPEEIIPLQVGEKVMTSIKLLILIHFGLL